MSTLSATAVEVLAVGDDAVACAAALVSPRLATIAITKIKAVSLLRIGLSFFLNLLLEASAVVLFLLDAVISPVRQNNPPSRKKREKDGAPEHQA
jgi:hypothetical protein